MSLQIANVELTHPERVVYMPQRITKRDVAVYYETIAPRILPHIANRPLTLVRCPRGSDHECFFQKHADKNSFPYAHHIEIQEEKKIGTYLEIDNVQGLISLVQMGVLEIHTWGSRIGNIEKPDRMIFDLRNVRGATAIAPYSLRARRNAPVATPITWEELVQGTRPDQFTIQNLHARLKRLRQEPWKDFPGLKKYA